MAYGINADAQRQSGVSNLKTMMDDLAQQRSTSASMSNSALDREMDRQKLEQQTAAEQERLRLEEERIRSQEDMQRERIDAERQSAIQSLISGMLGNTPTTSKSGGAVNYGNVTGGRDYYRNRANQVRDRFRPRKSDAELGGLKNPDASDWETDAGLSYY